MKRNSLLLIFAIIAGTIVFTVGLGYFLDSIFTVIYAGKLIFGLIALSAGLAISIVCYRHYEKQRC